MTFQISKVQQKYKNRPLARNYKTTQLLLGIFFQSIQNETKLTSLAIYLQKIIIQIFYAGQPQL